MSFMSNLAVVNFGRHDYGEAERLAKTVLELRTKALGAKHVDTLDSMKILGSIYEAEGKHAEAEPLLTNALQLRREVSGVKHPATLDLMNAVATLRISQGRFADAETVLKEAMEIQKDAQTYRRFWTESLLGASLAGQKQYAEAEPKLVAGYEGMRQKAMTVPDLNRQDITKAKQFLATMYAETGKKEKAAELASSN
jgi:tetratricopeptide (TPR) repeat protein